jgi:LytS/YehU family sensor histidine kinase
MLAWVFSGASGFLLSLVLWLIYRKFKSSGENLFKLGMIVLTTSLVAGAVRYMIKSAFLGFVVYPDTPAFEWFGPENTIYVHINNIILNTLPLFGWGILYFGIRAWFHVMEEEERRQLAEKYAAESQLKMLRYQINPHFLFNTLTSIQGLVYKDPRRADQMIGQLSELLRYSLRSTDLNISLKEELEIIERYLQIEKIRFAGEIEYQIINDVKDPAVKVPCFITQAIVENAIRHGFKTSPSPLRVRIHAYLEDSNLLLVITNSGRWADPGDRTGIGLRNVINRLENSFPGRHTFEILKEDELEQVSVKIMIPVMETRDISTRRS